MGSWLHVFPFSHVFEQRYLAGTLSLSSLCMSSFSLVHMSSDWGTKFRQLNWRKYNPRNLICKRNGTLKPELVSNWWDLLILEEEVSFALGRGVITVQEWILLVCIFQCRALPAAAEEGSMSLSLNLGRTSWYQVDTVLSDAMKQTEFEETLKLLCTSLGTHTFKTWGTLRSTNPSHRHVVKTASVDFSSQT